MSAPTTERTGGAAQRGEPILSVRGLEKHFPIKGGGLVKRTVGAVRAVDGVDLDLYPGEVLGLVGESGCGKSTTGRAILNLQPATGGSVVFQGREIVGLNRKQMRPLRRDIQLVFQDPYASLNPRLPVFDIVAEPLVIHGLTKDNEELRARVRELVETVGLNPEHTNRYPAEFSGGQRQRIGIARALALQPKVLVLDEPVSALDVSIQAGVINLLEDLKNSLGLSYLFIAHDLSVVRHISDRVAVMYLGRIIEIAERDELFDRPAHPYTQALLSAIPLPDPRRERARQRIIISGDVPSPANPPSGCRFRTRCQKFANVLTDGQREKCMTDDPVLADRGAGHLNACHYAEAMPVL
ncbi:ABC transporter ATP-binding protein [Modestobacter versicolor]|uniref:Dipeptide/oligopeptide/nickel ABC transporter ATP-binding protein n=1 Tax=Modestobacter versicolor TaxID=429133 RepID=A0A323VD72_9ACTN|nr:oligopeptide/dipeptide ABC transporter ATP-binding protein [Modestobacter versicolor]MBB3676417.1 peptide/nickel transport system ATP-binding protein/oligopeptide transport system ATP-binding protein [Modestobacter versicolor]PZA22667.1 dipeptide/oligopeptide/nickel ABC transporter ATP-binding protein [Modestobacter versicolor]